MAIKKEIILGLTGSIAVYKSCDIIRRLRDKGCQVNVIMTKEAACFITPLLAETLSGNKVYQDLFDISENRSVQHISLAKRTKLILVAPATANIIGKIASGICDDLLSCTIMSTKAKVLFAPAMNTEMLNKKIVQENISKLKKSGYCFIDPIKGRLVCGEEGRGCLASVDEIVTEALKALK